MTWSTVRAMRPSIAPASGPISSSSLGRSAMSPEKASCRVASTSTCFSIALVTVVAIACCTAGSSMSGPTVATYRLVSLRSAAPSRPPPRAPVSTAARTKQIHATIDIPRPRPAVVPLVAVVSVVAVLMALLGRAARVLLAP